LIAPSLSIIGGQSIQASRLLRYLANEPSVQVRFLAVNSRLPAALSMKYVRTLISLVLYLARLVGNIGRADILHIFTPGYLSFYLFPVPALLLARLLRKRSILNYHDGRAEDHLAHWPAARRLMRLANTIVVPSEYLLAPEYNPACTLRAFALIQQRYPGARLTIAHDGPLRAELEALAASLGLRQTQFIGSVSPGNVAALYDAADIYLMSPDADNMPLSVLECFASGLPVVSSNAGGIPNLIEDETNGLLFAPNDHRAMAACALRLLEEPGLASRLAANALGRCAQYSWPEVGPQWTAHYRRLDF